VRLIGLIALGPKDDGREAASAFPVKSHLVISVALLQPLHPNQEDACISAVYLWRRSGWAEPGSRRLDHVAARLCGSHKGLAADGRRPIVGSGSVRCISSCWLVME
jgi:hypothetical protein